jgi:hypothetical protein
MTTYRGAYSGSGENPIPAKGSSVQDSRQDTAKQPQPKADRDYAGGLSAKKPTKGDKFQAGGDPDPRGAKWS